MRASVLLAVFAAACSQYTAKATVTIAVSGPGAVRTSSLQGDCRGTCWFSVARETPVHLEPVVDGQASFAGWSGACSGTGACDLKPGNDVSVAATFTPTQPRHLQVSMNGSGSVRSDPPGIDCPQTCAADFPDGTTVRLDASASSGWDFTGFGGACNGSPCTVTLSSDVSALATFLQRPVTVSVQMSGRGSVTSNPAGIDCPRICSAAFSSGTNLTLTASPESGFAFSGFAGACNGTGCAVQVSSDAQVSASFSAIPSFNVTVVEGGSGGGRVASSPPGIDCPGTCTATFLQGTPVALSAVPDELSNFTGWSGSCTGASCALVIRADAAVGARFEQQRYVALDLGTIANGWWSRTFAISRHGTLVAGWAGGPGEPFFWDGTMHEIVLNAGNASGVNDSGVVVGAYSNSSWNLQAFKWSSGVATDLPTLGGLASWASGINRDGLVSGWAARSDSVPRAVYWTAKGPVDLGSLGSGANACSHGFAINGAGVVVGDSCVDGTGSHAVRFRGPGEIDDLGTLGGMWGTANGINDAGAIVGVSARIDGTYHGFLYDGAKMIDAGTLPGTTYSSLSAINGSGVAVGASTTDGIDHGVVYAAGRLLDLNGLVDQTPYLIGPARGIDEAGNIVADGTKDGSVRALLLRPR
jgi:probable HAF family extracellular repeat protein